MKRVTVRIANKLAENLGLVKSASLTLKIHEDTLSFAHSLSSKKYKRLDTQCKLIKSVQEGLPSMQNVCILSLKVLQGRIKFEELQKSTTNVLEHTGTSSVDQLLLSLCPYTIYIDRYSKWYKVHDSNFIRAIGTYNRQLIAKLPEMTLEQLHFMFILFDVMAKRYPQYSLQDAVLSSKILSKLLIFAKQTSAELVKNFKQDYMERIKLQKNCKDLSSTLQTFYKCYYPYYETINTTLGPQRVHITHLVSAALYIQSLAARFNLLEGFEKLCLLLSLDDFTNVSIESAIKLVTLFGRNEEFYDNQKITLRDALIDELAKKLHSLTVHEYICDRDTHPEAMQLLTQVLDHVEMKDLHQCLDVLQSNDKLNANLHMLFLPFILDSLKNGAFNQRDLVMLMDTSSDSTFCHWTTWLVYYSWLDADNPEVCTDSSALNRLCESTIVQNENFINAKDVEDICQLRFIHLTKVGNYDPEKEDRSVTLFEALANSLQTIKYRKLCPILHEYSKRMRRVEHYLETNKDRTLPKLKGSIDEFNKHFSIAN